MIKFICEFQETIISLCSISAIITFGLNAKIKKPNANNDGKRDASLIKRVLSVSTLLLIIFVFTTHFIYIEHEEVPNLKGLSYDNASLILALKGFDVTVIDPVVKNDEVRNWQEPFACITP
jgi:hypothetical protein